MSNELTSQHNVAGPDPAEVLALVAANVSLPKPSSAALRLVCRATRLAVDHAIDDLTLKLAGGLHAVGTPLTTGLTSLTLSEPFDCDISAVAISNACLVALSNSSTLEKLVFPVFGVEIKESVTRVMLSALGASEWPKLSSLVVHSLPRAFDSFINIDQMPALIALELYGELTGTDFEALSRGQRFAANLELLRTEPYIPDGESKKEFYASMKGFLKVLPRLRELDISFSNLPGLRKPGFLATAELPSLESLTLSDLPSGASLAPITAIPRPRLQKLNVSGEETLPEDLAPLFSGVPGALSGLKELHMHFECKDWSFLRHVELNNLTELSLWMPGVGISAMADVAAALARLPALEVLDVHPCCVVPEFKESFKNGTAVRTLLAGVNMPRLRKLSTGLEWKCYDNSLEQIIEYADQMPQLEKITIDDGRISVEGISSLAEAGRRGSWPCLNYFHTSKIVTSEDGDVEYCLDLLQQVWPALKFSFHSEHDVGESLDSDTEEEDSE